MEIHQNFPYWYGVWWSCVECFRTRAELGIFNILGYDINTYNLFFKINYSLEYINLLD